MIIFILFDKSHLLAAGVKMRDKSIYNYISHGNPLYFRSLCLIYSVEVTAGVGIVTFLVLRLFINDFLLYFARASR